ncbi:MAG: hypothetical protein QOE49_405 [Rhodospirillaceae bacterium]|jgi:hypothetical protein|nr:hypothetical protein [Rhodospirillaceae bacterium]
MAGMQAETFGRRTMPAYVVATCLAISRFLIQ